jgi:hypothetical protein
MHRPQAWTARRSAVKVQPLRFGPDNEMPHAFTRTPLAAALLLTLSSCSAEVSYLYETYKSPIPVVVTIGCGDPYDTFENPVKKLVLVRSYALSEATRGACGAVGFRNNPPLQERARRAAQALLIKSNRPLCNVVGEGRPLSLLEWEFAYAC